MSGGREGRGAGGTFTFELWDEGRAGGHLKLQDLWSVGHGERGKMRGKKGARHDRKASQRKR